MNKTGIAWVNRVGNNWVYTRQINKKSVSISDPNIYNLHKKVIRQGNVWGIRDISLARKVINSNSTMPSTATKSDIVRVYYNRLNKYEFKAEVKGTIENNQF